MVKYNYVLAIVALIFTLISVLFAFFVSIFADEIAVLATSALLSGILGLLGIWLFDKDYKIAAVQYIVSGVCVLISISMFGIIGFVFYLIAGILAIVEKDKSKQMNTQSTITTAPNVHYFGDSNQNQESQQQATTVPSDKRLWSVPIITFIVIFAILLIAYPNGGSFNFGETETLDVSNVSITSDGYSMYTVSCDVVPKQAYDYLEMEVIFYDSNNAQIGKNTLVWNVNNPTENQQIKVSGTAMTNNQNSVPKTAEIIFYDDVLNSDPTDAIYDQNVTIN